MRQLTFRKRIQDGEFRSLERTYSIKIPNFFKDFMQTYGDSGVEERHFVDTNGDSWEVWCFCGYKTMYEFVGEFLENRLGFKIPFAFDRGGWLFCLSLDEIDYNSIHIYRFDHKPEEVFLKIADNFE
jgi:hypothetical protein